MSKIFLKYKRSHDQEINFVSKCWFQRLQAEFVTIVFVSKVIGYGRQCCNTMKKLYTDHNEREIPVTACYLLGDYMGIYIYI